MGWRVAILGGHVPSQQRLLAGVRRFLSTTALSQSWELWSDCPGILGNHRELQTHQLEQCPVDGVLYVGPRTFADGPILWEMFNRLTVPVVCAGTFLHKGPRAPCVVPDDRAAGQAIARHLLDKGFQRFAFYNAEGESPVFVDREQAFIAEIQKRGYSVSVHRSAVPTPPDRVAEMFRQLNAWLTSLPRPVAIGAYSDAFAMGVMNACQHLSIRVPEDAAILGAGNDINICEAVIPALSSVDLDLVRVGHEAAAMLDRLLDRQKLSADLVRIPPKGIAQRESTSQGPVPDAEVASCLHYIHEHLGEGVTIDQLAEHIQVSKRTLQARFQQAIGRAPGRVIRDMQIDRALSLLRDTDWKIMRIATACGFCSQSHFNLAFSRRMGIPPNQYRNKSSKGGTGGFS